MRGVWTQIYCCNLKRKIITVIGKIKNQKLEIIATNNWKKNIMNSGRRLNASRI